MVQQNSTANVDLDNDQSTTVILKHIKNTEEELEIKVKDNINASSKAQNEAEKERLMDERKKMLAERKQLKEERGRLIIQRANLKAEREKLMQLEADFAEAVRSHNIEESDRAANEEKKRRLEAQKERLETQRERLEAEKENALKMQEQQLKAKEVRLQQEQEQERIREEQQRQRELEELQREARERQKEDIIKQQEAEKGASFVIEVAHDEHRQGRPDVTNVKTLTVNFGPSSISRSSSGSDFEFPSSLSNSIPGAAATSSSSGASASVTPGPSFVLASDGSISTVSAEVNSSISTDTGVSATGFTKANVPVTPSGYSVLFPGASGTTNASITPTPTFVTAPNGSVSTVNAGATTSAHPTASIVTASDGSVSTITAAPFAASADNSESPLVGTATSQSPTATTIASSDSEPIPPVITARPPRARNLVRRVFREPSPDLKCFNCSPAQCAVRAHFCIFAPNRAAADALQDQRDAEENRAKNKAAEKQQEDTKQKQNEDADDKDEFESPEDRILAEMEEALEASDEKFVAELQKLDKDHGDEKGDSST